LRFIRRRASNAPSDEFEAVVILAHVVHHHRLSLNKDPRQGRIVYAG